MVFLVSRCKAIIALLRFLPGLEVDCQRGRVRNMERIHEESQESREAQGELTRAFHQEEEKLQRVDVQQGRTL